MSVSHLVTSIFIEHNQKHGHHYNDANDNEHVKQRPAKPLARRLAGTFCVWRVTAM